MLSYFFLSHFQHYPLCRDSKTSIPLKFEQNFATKFVYFFVQSDSFFKLYFSSSIDPQNISAIWQMFCTFPLYCLFSRKFLNETQYCSLGCQSSFVQCFGSFVLVLGNTLCLNFVYIIYIYIYIYIYIFIYIYIYIYIYIGIYGWKSFLPSQILCMYMMGMHCKSFAYIFIYKPLQQHFHGNTVIFYWILSYSLDGRRGSRTPTWYTRLIYIFGILRGCWVRISMFPSRTLGLLSVKHYFHFAQKPQGNQV